MKLTISKLREEAITFCKHESTIIHEELVGVTDGKAVGTYIEHKFEEYLKNKYEITIGSSGKGIDLPDPHINTDIKVTSVKKPQSSSPFKNIEQKIYGLGYNLLIFVYEKIDIANKCYLDFKHCILIKSERTGDYNLTKILRKLIELGAKESDIIEILKDNNIPGDNQILEILAKKIIKNPPKQGYLTISNALQWRLRYINVINLEENVDGIYTYGQYTKKELDKYQTSLFFTDKVCEYLKNDLKIQPEIIIEPTYGINNFLKSASRFFPNKKLYRIEINEKRINSIDTTTSNPKFINEDIITYNFDNIDENNSFLIIGAITLNIELNKSESEKNHSNSDFKNVKTKMKLTSKNNFDNSESIILKIIDELKNTKSTIVFLCKTTTSRNVFRELIKNNIIYSFVKQINIDSSEIFKINDTYCLFIIQFGEKTLSNKICEVSDFSNPSKVLYDFGYISDEFYFNIKNIPPIDGKCEKEWSQGVKHDCAGIMELICKNNQLINKNNENINIEHSFVYPLLKSSNLKKPIVNETLKYIIITQQRTRQDTTYLKTEAPKTWKYLNDNKKYFDKRKSKIYKNAPDFSIGIGNNSFKKYKVAISGFNKEPIFSLVYNEKTMMLDDSCYFLPFDDYDSAYITMLILNSNLVKKFLKNIASLDSKRPFSKKILKRIDISKCLDLLSFKKIKEIEKELSLKDYITLEKFTKYKNEIKMGKI
ncbi:hypothetical protein [Methanobrevibacter sp.]|uniref:hypothetical protein n=1 Tax=Methanobrevibacter sp. TaxID=66852 RepID=UPI00388EC74D